MVKDLTFLPTAVGEATASSRASTSRIKLEDTLANDDEEDEEDNEDQDAIMRQDAGGEETGGYSRFLSCSSDKTIKLWDAQSLKQSAMEAGDAKIAARPLQTYLGRIGFKCV
jgi:WD40 repeat protein